MARPKKTIEQTWYDLFSDADVCEQSTMLRILEELHHQKRRGKLESNSAKQDVIELKEPA